MNKNIKTHLKAIALLGVPLALVGLSFIVPYVIASAAAVAFIGLMYLAAWHTIKQIEEIDNE